MWLRSFLTIVFLIDRGLSIPEPGQLRVPKVYNAVITSNQNLAPSRAYPVIQPIVHRTAIGYVPPFYYTQIAPGFGGPGVVQLEPGQRSRPDDAESVETPNDSSSRKRISGPPSRNRQSEDTSREELSSESDETRDSEKNDDKGKKNDRVPLNFYPNYRSIYYDPYFYPYNAFPPHPGTYYVDYPRPPGFLGPLPLPVPVDPGLRGFPIPAGPPDISPDEATDRDLPNRRGEKQRSRTSERREKIPDVPIPPLPISIGKKTS